MIYRSLLSRALSDLCLEGGSVCTYLFSSGQYFWVLFATEKSENVIQPQLCAKEHEEAAMWRGGFPVVPNFRQGVFLKICED